MQIGRDYSQKLPYLECQSRRRARATLPPAEISPNSFPLTSENIVHRQRRTTNTTPPLRRQTKQPTPVQAVQYLNSSYSITKYHRKQPENTVKHPENPENTPNHPSPKTRRWGAPTTMVREGLEPHPKWRYLPSLSPSFTSTPRAADYTHSPINAFIEEHIKNTPRLHTEETTKKKPSP